VAARAIAFDFNGTLSQDETVLCDLFVELFGELGRPMSAQEYFDRLAGRSDREIVREWLGEDHPEAEWVIAERSARYRARLGDGSSVPEPVREAVRYAAARVPVAVVSGAERDEIVTVLEAAGLAPLFGAIVSVEDVSAGKPDPAGYLLALELLGGGLRAADVVAIEDTEAGVAAARSAGMRCVAVLGTLAPERLAAADEIVGALDAALIERLLG
jgi:beta-phosphoglucomutase